MCKFQWRLVLLKAEVALSKKAILQGSQHDPSWLRNQLDMRPAPNTSQPATEENESYMCHSLAMGGCDGPAEWERSMKL